MRGPLLPGVPSWVVLVLSLSVLALATFYLVGRSPPAPAPTGYDELRRRYEPVVRLTITVLMVGTVFGFVLGAQLDKNHALHLGIGAGTGALCALCFLSSSLSTGTDRSWRQYLQYQGMYRRQYLLPPIGDVLVLLLLVAWGIYSVMAIVLGT